MMNSIKTPTRTYALVVGIEKYDLGPESDLNGPAHDAYAFAEWLVSQGVPQKNIALLLSPLARDTRFLQAWSAAPQWPATRKGVSDAVTQWLPKQSGGLLWVFWGGHGIMTATRSRRLFYADTTIADWYHLNLEACLTRLSSDYLPGFQQQIYLIDTCANYQKALPPERLGDGDSFPSGVPVRGCEQFVFFATREGEIAKNISQEQTGLFSKTVLEELAKASSTSWPPDMEKLAGNVRVSFSELAKVEQTLQTPIFVSYRTWDGREYSFSHQTEQTLSLWNIPFPPKQFFTGREKQLKQLYKKMQEMRATDRGQRQAISGLGGIGKTQLAVEYAYRHRQEYQAVLWAHAETAETLIKSYTEIARLLQIPQQDAENQEKIIQGVKDWLSQRRNWLLILDNADEPEVLIPFLPPQVGGHLLVTTRSADLSSLGLGFGHAIIVPKFTKQEDVPFLLRRAGRKRVSSADREYARHIADELDGLPLALNQVGVYLARTGSSLAAYWDLYRKQRATLFNIPGDREYPVSVAATLLLSFRRVERRNPAAADLLQLCAFLAPDAIPEELLTKGAKELGDRLAPVAADAIQLDQAFVDLRSYSLLTRDPQTSTLFIHRVLQAVLRDNMTVEAKQQWKQRAVLAVNTAFPEVEQKAWPQCERFLPHALEATRNIEQFHVANETAGHLLHTTATYLRDRARYTEAEPLYQRALHLREQWLGREHPDVAQTLNEQAILYVHQAKYPEAESLFLRALQIREQQEGNDHPDVASTLNGLGILYKEQGRLAKAESSYLRALQICEQLEQDHPQIAISSNNLAVLYYQQGKYPKAESLYLRALQIWEKQLEPMHPQMASPLNNLGNLYLMQGRYIEAEPLYLRALQIREQQWGSGHPETAHPSNNLAELYREQGKYSQAEPLYLRALQIWEKQFDPEHPLLTYPLHGLGDLNRAQGNFAEAERLCLRALQICEQRLKPEHSQKAHSLNGLGDIYREQRKYPEAKACYRRALFIRKHTLGSQHAYTAETMHSIALFREAQDNSKKARAWYIRALGIRVQALGVDHPKTIETRTRLIALLQSMARHEDVGLLLQRTQTIREQQVRIEPLTT